MRERPVQSRRKQGRLGTVEEVTDQAHTSPAEDEGGQASATSVDKKAIGAGTICAGLQTSRHNNIYRDNSFLARVDKLFLYTVCFSFLRRGFIFSLIIARHRNE
jgi:hypothetical protein